MNNVKNIYQDQADIKQNTNVRLKVTARIKM